MKKILIIADLRGWIFQRHALEIKKRLTEYDIEIGYCRGFNLTKGSQNKDLIYAMDPLAVPYLYPKKTIIGARVDWFHMKHPEGAKGMFEKGLRGVTVPIEGNCCMMHTVNKNQFNLFKEVANMPVFLVQHGIDKTCFDANLYTKQKNDVLTVGTAGRGNSPNQKGFDLVQRACRKLGIRHYETTYRRRIPKDKMPEFYNNLDVYVCMSKFEGLHNPTMEAGAMRIPVISTRCGAAEEIIRDGENGLLINRRENALIEALEKMKDEKARLSMGRELYKEIMSNWTWDTRIEDFRTMFNAFFNK